jgi:hypothetical protein
MIEENQNIEIIYNGFPIITIMTPLLDFENLTTTFTHLPPLWQFVKGDEYGI